MDPARTAKLMEVLERLNALKFSDAFFGMTREWRDRTNVLYGKARKAITDGCHDKAYNEILLDAMELFTYQQHGMGPMDATDLAVMRNKNALQTLQDAAADVGVRCHAATYISNATSFDRARLQPGKESEFQLARVDAQAILAKVQANVDSLSAEVQKRNPALKEAWAVLAGRLHGVLRMNDTAILELYSAAKERALACKA